MAGSLAEIKEASIVGPVACTEAQATTVGYAKGLRGQYNKATAITVVSDALPTQSGTDDVAVTPLRKHFMRVFNRHPTAILDFAFGIGSAPALTYAPTSNMGTGNAAAGAPIGPMSYQDFVVPDGATHYACILDSAASPATGIVSLWCAEDNIS